MDKDSATGPDRAGVRWLLLVANSEHRVHPDFSGLELLTLVVKKLAAGDFSSDVGHLISAANLIALDKGGAKIRPIAIGVVMRRLITKSLMPTSIDEAKTHLQPLQVGCGVKAGLDAIVHDARDAIVNLDHDPTYIAVSVDACNAFNRTSRAEMLRQTANHAPSLIRFVNALYAKGMPFLRFGDEHLRSQEGAQQGDPASSLMFALAIHPIVQRIEAECDLVVHRWYADDGLLVGKIDQVKLALDIIAEEGEKISFILQPTKTKAYWPTQSVRLISPLTKA